MSPADAAPRYLRPLLDRLDETNVGVFEPHRLHPPPEARRAAVLVLFGDGAAGPDLLFLERASTLRNHAGQVAFPGGGIDPTDGGPVAAALREAQEETGLDPSGVVPLRLLPELYVPPSGFAVTPVLGYWSRPTPVRAVDPGETARVVRIPVAALTDPANRLLVIHPSGYRGPAFSVEGLLVWGFTGGLLSALLDHAGWTLPWDSGRVVELGEAWSIARRSVARGSGRGQEVSER